jgi:hypothetical protein
MEAGEPSDDVHHQPRLAAAGDPDLCSGSGRRGCRRRAGAAAVRSGMDVRARRAGEVDERAHPGGGEPAGAVVRVKGKRSSAQSGSSWTRRPSGSICSAWCSSGWAMPCPATQAARSAPASLTVSRPVTETPTRSSPRTSSHSKVRWLEGSRTRMHSCARRSSGWRGSPWRATYAGEAQVKTRTSSSRRQVRPRSVSVAGVFAVPSVAGGTRTSTLRL